MHSSKACVCIHAYEHAHTFECACIWAWVHTQHTHTHNLWMRVWVCAHVFEHGYVCVLVSCVFYFRYTSGDYLIDIVSQLWECLSHRWLFSHGNSEVMHSACVCILSVVLFISDTLLVIVSSTLFLHCGVFVSSTIIIQPWKQWGNAFSLCVHFVNYPF